MNHRLDQLLRQLALTPDLRQLLEADFPSAARRAMDRSALRTGPPPPSLLEFVRLWEREARAKKPAGSVNAQEVGGPESAQDELADLRLHGPNGQVVRTVQVTVTIRRSPPGLRCVVRIPTDLYAEHPLALRGWLLASTNDAPPDVERAMPLRPAVRDGSWILVEVEIPSPDSRDDPSTQGLGFDLFCEESRM